MQWAILTVTRGGVVSLLQNLDEETTKATFVELSRLKKRDPMAGIYDVNHAALMKFRRTSDGFTSTYRESASDIVALKLIGPPLDVWPPVPDGFDEAVDRRVNELREKALAAPAPKWERVNLTTTTIAAESRKKSKVRRTCLDWFYMVRK